MTCNLAITSDSQLRILGAGQKELRIYEDHGLALSGWFVIDDW